MPPVYLSTHYGVTLPSPIGMVVNAMSKIAPATQQKNSIDIFNFLNIQGSDLQYLNG